MSTGDETVVDLDQTGDVLLDVVDGVATVTISNPGRRNAISVSMARRLAAVADQIDADESVYACILAGEGDHFCAGAVSGALDLTGSGPASPHHYERSTAVYSAIARVAELRVPSIAAVAGAAVGAGMNLMLATDVRVVASDARLISGFTRIGVHPGGGHGALLASRSRPEAVIAMAIFNQEVKGADAPGLGLAWKAVPKEELEQTARSIASAAGTDAALVRAATRSLRLTSRQTGALDAAIEIERGPQMWSLARRADADPNR